MYIRPYKKESTRSQGIRVSQDLCDLRSTKRFKGDYEITFPEYIAHQDIYRTGLGGRDPYNRYIEDGCEGEDGWEKASGLSGSYRRTLTNKSVLLPDSPASSLSSDSSTLSWGTAVFTELQEKNSPPRRKSINQGRLVQEVPLTIETCDTTSIKSELSTHLQREIPIETKQIPCILPYSRIDTKSDFRAYIPVTLGFLPDPNIPRLESERPWYFERPESPDPETDTYTGLSYSSEIEVLPQYNNYELQDERKYLNLDEGARNLSYEYEGDYEEDLEVESCIEALREYLHVVSTKVKTIAAVDDYGIDKWSQNYNPFVPRTNIYPRSYTVKVLENTCIAHTVGEVGFTVAQYMGTLQDIQGDRNSKMFKTGKIYLGHIIQPVPKLDLVSVLHAWKWAAEDNCSTRSTEVNVLDHTEIEVRKNPSIKTYKNIYPLPYPKWVPSTVKQLEQKARTSPIKILIVHPLSMFRAKDPELRLAQIDNAPGFREYDGISIARQELRADRLHYVYLSLLKEWIHEKEYLYGNQDTFNTLMNSCCCVIPDKGFYKLESFPTKQHK